MKRIATWIPAVALAAAVFLVPSPSAGQAKGKGGAKAAVKGYVAPRAHDGKADLQGIWQIFNTSIAAGIEAHTPALGIQAGLGAIVDPADGKIPYKPEARAKQQENFKNRAKLDPMHKCYMPGVPRLLALPFPLQILQTPKAVVMLSEYGHTTRNLFLTGEHLEGLELWMGDSRGKWEGDTLVVDVRQFNADTWLDSSGNHHSAGLQVTERFTRTGPDVLTYEATMVDPAVYTQPWTIRLQLLRHTEAGARVLEYDCNAYMEFEGAR